MKYTKKREELQNAEAAIHSLLPGPVRLVPSPAVSPVLRSVYGNASLHFTQWYLN